MLIFCAKVEGARMLKVRREDDGLVTGLTRQLDPEIPGIQSHKRELQVRLQQVLLYEGVKTVDGFAECAGMLDVLPGQSGQACCAVVSLCYAVELLAETYTYCTAV
jgi:hypothetical protein